MAIRVATYAFVRPVPYLLVKGSAAQVISAPIRYGSGGSLQAPTSGTCTITKPDGTTFASAAVTVTSSVATYSVADTSAQALGAGWTVVWALTMADTLVYTFRQSAYLVNYLPPNNISEVELYTRIPDLRVRIPQEQGPTADGGDGTGWQPQIDEAYYQLIQRMLDDGREPWLIREVSGYREWLLVRALQLCVQTIPYKQGDVYAQKAADLAYDLRRAEGNVRLQYDTDDVATRRAGSPVVRLCQVGRPSQ